MTCHEVLLAAARLSRSHSGDLSSSALSNAKLIEVIKKWADQDGLTGLLNKRAFLKKTGESVYECEREHQPLSVVILDVDDFKHYNDTNGHLAGDEVLHSIGRILKQTVRGDDIAAYYRSDVFIVAMPAVGQEGAMQTAAQKIRRAIEEERFANQEVQPGGNLTISGGIAVMPLDGGSVSDLISHADQCLYSAKKEGSNRIVHVPSPAISMLLN